MPAINPPKAEIGFVFFFNHVHVTITNEILLILPQSNSLIGRTNYRLPNLLLELLLRLTVQNQEPHKMMRKKHKWKPSDLR